MRKEKLLKFLGMLFMAWGFWVFVNIIRQIPFDFLDPAYFAVVGLMLVLLLGGGTMFHIANKMKKQNSVIETDEIFKKVGYTALAASFQVFLILVPIVLCLDRFFSFLDKMSAKDIVTIFWFGSLFLVVSFSGWYSHHPDKTWL